jgi:beta-glucosidase/6-phospho-beta-glucosidase/beta-galactosidase
MQSYVLTPSFESPARAGSVVRPNQQRGRANAGAPVPIEILTGFESTYAPLHNRDVCETNCHVDRRCEDLDLLVASGVRRVRYPVRWHRVEEVPGELDWRETDEAMECLLSRGLQPIADLLHHTSHPAWLDFADPRFRPAFLAYVEAFARRYPWIESYTLFNEPFSTLYLSGKVGAWPPYYTDVEGMVRLWKNVLPAWSEAGRMCKELLPNARHVHTDTCEHHDGDTPMAELANDRRFAILDLLLGLDLNPDRPFFREMIEAGGEELLSMTPGHVDVVGLDYYAHNQWSRRADRDKFAPTDNPLPLSKLIGQYWQRYQRPCLLGETNIRGTASDRASWFKYTLEQCELAAVAGVPLEGHCWFPFVDSCDWNSLLRRCDGSRDPVGIYSLDEEMNRHAGSITTTFEMAASGCPASELPAYEFQQPIAHWIRGWMPQMAHWEWQAPPKGELAQESEPEEFDPLGALEISVAA